jgi:hypothetical protein
MQSDSSAPLKDSFYGEDPIAQGAALTAQLTTLTASAPGTPDYSLGTVTTTNGAGFSSVDECLTVVAVIINLQTRLAEVEARLEAAGLVASN